MVGTKPEFGELSRHEVAVLRSVSDPPVFFRRVPAHTEGLAAVNRVPIKRKGQDQPVIVFGQLY